MHALTLVFVPVLDPVVVVGLGRRANSRALSKDIEEPRKGCRRSADAVLGSGCFPGVGFAAFGVRRFSLRGCVRW